MQECYKCAFYTHNKCIKNLQETLIETNDDFTYYKKCKQFIYDLKRTTIKIPHLKKGDVVFYNNEEASFRSFEIGGDFTLKCKLIMKHRTDVEFVSPDELSIYSNEEIDNMIKNVDNAMQDLMYQEMVKANLYKTDNNQP